MSLVKFWTQKYLKIGPRLINPKVFLEVFSHALIVSYIHLEVTSALLRTASVIQQFIEGMNTCGNLWHQVERNWIAFLPIFTSTSREMSLPSFKGLYKISWSPQGSNQREREEETMFGWEMFLIAIQGASNVPPLCVLFRL